MLTKQKSFLFLMLCIVIQALFFSCTDKNSVGNNTTTWSWLPKDLKDTVVFARGIISDTGRTEMAVTFTPDGDTVFFAVHTGRMEGRNNWAIMYSVYGNGTWSKPDTCSFSGRFPDYGPYMSPDGSALYFASRRPVTDTGTKVKGEYDLWVTKRNGTDWEKPVRLADGINTNNEEYTLSVGFENMYVCARRYDSLGRTDLFTVPVKEIMNPYSPIRNLGAPPNDGMWEGQTYVHPDESFLIMTYLDENGSETSEDIYIVRKEENGWSKKVKLNGVVNTNVNEHAYWVTPDGKYLFFGRYNDIYIASLEAALK